MAEPESGGDPPEHCEDDATLLDAREAAQLCRISISMLYKLNAEGRMPAPVRIGSLMRWRRKDLVDWIRRGCPENRAEG